MSSSVALGVPPTVHGLVERLPECGVWAVNPYERCSFRCVYCITGVQGRSVARAPANEVVARVRAELATVNPGETLVVGAFCDPYPPSEADAGVTRSVLRELSAQGRRFGVVTKGTTVVRDADVLAAPGAHVTISLSSMDAEALAILDPGAPSPEARLEVVAALVAAGVHTLVSVAPWIPGTSDAATIAAAARVAAGRDIWVQVAPLNVRAPAVAASPFARNWDQSTINQAYRQARAATPPQQTMTWMPPIPLEGVHARALYSTDDIGWCNRSCG